MKNMKNVGIMSMQRIKNYGSFLQSYALKSVIESFGNNVKFIDYTVEPCIVKNSGNRQNKINLLVRYIKHRNTPKKRKMYQTAKKFNENYEEYYNQLGISSKKIYRDAVDCLVIGSDEVFNCLQSNDDVGYSKELFGFNRNSTYCISYAASFGSTTYEELVNYGIFEEIAIMLSSFNAISVRDENSAQIVKKLINRRVNQNVDPVFIYDFEKEVSNKKMLDNYIVVYSYRGRMLEKEGKIIRKFAKKNNKKLISLGGVSNFCDDYILCSPFEVLNYVKFADYVITDTFHGTVFSIKYQKKFVSMVRNNNKQKLLSLLHTFDLDDRLLSDLNKLEETIIKDYDYELTKVKINNEIAKSINYLQKEIG